LVVTFFQFSQQQQTAQSQIKQQQQAAHDLLISNQISKGFEQLASDKIAMRLGGIYALEGVMNTSEQYHGSALEGLCAFVRENTIGKTASKDKPATDVQVALTVIGKRVEGSGVVDLANVSIPWANLIRADLTNAKLSSADLINASLGGAKLGGAILISVKLGGANLADANLSGANLIGADLSGADLSGAILTGANLIRVNLSDADLRKADLSGADLRNADLRNANLLDAILTGAKVTQGQLDEACGLKKPCPPPHVP
jgi:uncharacterized protein YjbI with pentapeptide repeats